MGARSQRPRSSPGSHTPSASHPIRLKKTLKWQTPFGWVEVQQAQWRLGRRGGLLRPLCERAGITPRGRSRRRQRARVDFGAEESFARAAQRVQEHYGLDVAASSVRRQTLAHGAQISALLRRSAGGGIGDWLRRHRKRPSPCDPAPAQTGGRRVERTQCPNHARTPSLPRQPTLIPLLANSKTRPLLTVSLNRTRTIPRA